MSRKRRKSAGPPEAVRYQTLESEIPGAELAAPNSEALRADHQLAKRCVAGEVAAWETLHRQCHDSLVATVRVLLSGRSDDANLIDEITSDVWYALVADDGELLTRYAPDRGARLITFMRAIARDIIGRHFRSERRRVNREFEASSQKPQHYSAELDQFDVSLDEFLATLPPEERQFCGDHVLSSCDARDDASTNGVTRANFWQKTHRLYDKFCRFFKHGTI